MKRQLNKKTKKYKRDVPRDSEVGAEPVRKIRDKKLKSRVKREEKKFNEAGIYGSWAYNAARRVVKLYEDGMDFEKAVYKVYRGL